MADPRNRGARAQGHAERRQFPAGPFSRRTAAGAPRRPTRSCASAASCCGASAATGCRTHLRMTIGSEEANGASSPRCREFLPGPGRAMAEPDLRAPGADRHRADRLVDRHGARERGLPSRSSSRAAAAETVRDGGAAQLGDSYTTTRRRGGRGRRPRDPLDAGRRLRGEVARQIAPALKDGAIVPSRLGQGVGDRGRSSRSSRRRPFRARRIPVAGTEHSGPEAGFAELFADRWCILTPPRRDRPGGGRTHEGVLGRARRECRGR